MNYLLFTDPHFVDTPLESYRWDIFKVLEREAKQHDVNRIICLGDVTDRKDRHSGLLVNKLIEHFSDLKRETKADILILAGNHDKPLTGPYYWDFLNKIGVRYLQEPCWENEVVYLPYTHNPLEDWKDVAFHTRLRAIFMHQTVEGSLVENDYKVEGTPGLLAYLPTYIPIYSGDVHRPQQIRNICYIGVPHPTRFSENWANRIILIKDNDFSKPVDIWIDSIIRSIVDIEELDSIDPVLKGFQEKDQVKLRVKLSNQRLLEWPEYEQRIRTWCKEQKITLVSIEPLLIGDGLRSQSTDGKVDQIELLPPEQVVQMFATQEKLSEDLLKMGQECIKENL